MIASSLFEPIMFATGGRSINIKGLLSHKTIKGKFFILTVALTITPMLILSIIFYNIITAKMKQNAEINVNSSLQTGINNLTRAMGELDDLTKITIINPQFQHMISDDSTDYYNYVQNINQTQNFLYTINQSKPYISNYLIFRHAASPGFSFFRNISDVNSPYRGDYSLIVPQTAEKLYNSLKDATSNIWYNENPLFEKSGQKENNGSMFYFKKIRSLSNDMKELGFLMLEVNTKKLFDGISYLNLPRNSHLLWVNSLNNEIIYDNLQPNKKTDFSEMLQQLSLQADSGNFDTLWSGTRYMVTYLTDPKTNLRVIHIIELNQLYVEAKEIRRLTVIIFIIILGIGLLIAFWLGNTISRPLKKLVSMMNIKVKAVSSSPLQFDSGDEVGQIGIRFIRMLAENDELHAKMIVSLMKQKEAEVTALQAQINPHFLYNTLESLNWLALSQKQYEISEVVRSLGNFFRLTISKGHDLIAVSQEIDHVISYVQVQKFRYKDKFDFISEISEQMHDFKIPKFILQPLVENAIYHGLKLKEALGTIMLTGEIVDGSLVFGITDDGEGISADRLQLIQDTLNGKTVMSSYGLKNVHDRLQLKFGNGYGIHIASEKGLYTTVTVRMPIILSAVEENNYDHNHDRG
jgi:two-component system sensor histidine kinase YesM